jgi:hypothetical protein
MNKICVDQSARKEPIVLSAFTYGRGPEDKIIKQLVIGKSNY